MTNVQLRFLFDKAKQATDTKKGLLQIEVRLTGSYEKSLISTGIHLTKNQLHRTSQDTPLFILQPKSTLYKTKNRCR